MLLDHGIRDDGDQGHEATKGDTADFEKNPEQPTERDRLCGCHFRMRIRRIGRSIHLIFPLGTIDGTTFYFLFYLRCSLVHAYRCPSAITHDAAR